MLFVTGMKIGCSAKAIIANRVQANWCFASPGVRDLHRRYSEPYERVMNLPKKSLTAQFRIVVD
jgi:hypothetical protein